MRLEKLTLDNWCQHEHKEFVFHPGLNGIIGQNGRGKSNTLRALKRVLRGGDAASIGTKDQDLKWGAEKGSVALNFVHDGQKGVLKRSIKTSTASLEWGGQKFKTLPEITEHMNALLGVGNKVLDDIVFVGQGTIEGIIFSKPSERAKTLYALLGLDGAEKIREYLGDRLTTMFVQSVDDDINKMLAHRVMLAKSISDYADKIAALRKCVVITKEDAEAAQGKIAYADRYAIEKRRVDQAQVEIATSSKRLASVTEEFKHIDESIKQLEDTLNDPATQALYNEAKARSVNLHKNRQRHQEFLAAQNALTKATRDLAALEVPADCGVSPEDVNKLREELAGLKAGLNQYQDLSNLVDVASCPTCGQKLPVSAIKEMDAKRKALLAKIKSTEAAYSAKSHTIVQHEEKKLEHGRKSAALANAIARAEAVISAGDAEPENPDDADTIAAVDEVKVNLKGLTERRAQHLAEQASLKSTLVASQGVVTEFNKLDIPLSSAELSSLKQLIDESAKAESEVKVNEALKNAAESDLKKTEEALEELNRKKAAQGGIAKCRELFERARAVLHRDQLPNLAARKFVSVINSGMNRHLELFQAPFSAVMQPDLSFICKFGGQPEMPVDRLSGGQRVALSLAFRFALHDLFASKLGLMILDEPSNYLDEERVKALATLLERIKANACARGLQMVVVTHEQRLMRVFDQVFEL